VGYEPNASGKTTMAAKLIRLGHAAIDADDEIPGLL
jgi:dephospho-CoA kinase